MADFWKAEPQSFAPPPDYTGQALRGISQAVEGYANRKSRERIAKNTQNAADARAMERLKFSERAQDQRLAATLAHENVLAKQKDEDQAFQRYKLDHQTWMASYERGEQNLDAEPHLQDYTPQGRKAQAMSPFAPPALSPGAPASAQPSVAAPQMPASTPAPAAAGFGASQGVRGLPPQFVPRSSEMQDFGTPSGASVSPGTTGGFEPRATEQGYLLGGTTIETQRTADMTQPQRPPSAPALNALGPQSPRAGSAGTGASQMSPLAPVIPGGRPSTPAELVHAQALASMPEVQRLLGTSQPDSATHVLQRLLYGDVGGQTARSVLALPISAQEMRTRAVVPRAGTRPPVEPELSAADQKEIEARVRRAVRNDPAVSRARQAEDAIDDPTSPAYTQAHQARIAAESQAEAAIRPQITEAYIRTKQATRTHDFAPRPKTGRGNRAGRI